MLKVVSLLKRKEGLSLDEFRAWATQEHPQLGKQLNGIRAYRMSVVREDNPELPYDAVSEFWFDDQEARDAAFDTDLGRSVVADALGHCSTRTHLLTDETIIIP